MAKATGEWLSTRHNPDGGIAGMGVREISPQPSLVFDTGMALQGYVELQKTTGDKNATRFARHCMDLLCETQNLYGLICHLL